MSRGNPLLEAILDRGAPFTSGPQWISEHLLRGRWVLAVAGTHGKTTTAAMLAAILEHAGMQPGFLIGGVPLDFGVTARLGGAPAQIGAVAPGSSFFVVEADEYDTAFFDKRSKFVHYFPRTAVLNNLEYDHADIFPDLAAIESQFHILVRCVPALGRLIVNGNDGALTRVLARGCWSERESFDADGDWQAVNLLRGRTIGRLRLPQAGAHNRSNALAAIAAARHAGVPPALALEALARFRGVKRRLELRGERAGVAVYDDFAHHPTPIATTIAGLRRKVGTQRILAVLEMRTNTMKLGSMKALLPASLAAADLVFSYTAATGKGAIDWNMTPVLAPLGDRAHSFSDLAALIRSVAAAARPSDHVLVMSNGGFGGVHDKLLAALAARAPALNAAA